jgi:hypothetical protein
LRDFSTSALGNWYSFLCSFSVFVEAGMWSFLLCWVGQLMMLNGKSVKLCPQCLVEAPWFLSLALSSDQYFLMTVE